MTYITAHEHTKTLWMDRRRRHIFANTITHTHGAIENRKTRKNWQLENEKKKKQGKKDRKDVTFFLKVQGDEHEVKMPLK